MRLAFDGVRVMQRVGDWQIDGFALVPVHVQSRRVRRRRRAWTVVLGRLRDRARSLSAARSRPLLPRAVSRDRRVRARNGARAAAHDRDAHLGRARRLRLQRRARLSDRVVRPGQDRRLDGGLGHGLHVQAASNATRVGLQANATSGDSDPHSPTFRRSIRSFPAAPTSARPT